MSKYAEVQARQARERQQRLDDATFSQVEWLKRIFWLLLIVLVILPFLGGILWVFLAFGLQY